MSRSRSKYGKMNSGKKVHKSGNPWGRHLSKCGAAILDKRFNSIKGYATDELCKKCFPDREGMKFKRNLQKLLHLEEDLFKL